MKYLSNKNTIHNYSNQFGIEYAVSDIFLWHFFSCSQQLKFTKLPTRENFESTRKYFRPTKYLKKLAPTNYPREKILDPRNTHEESLFIHKLPTGKKLGPTKDPRIYILDPRNSYEKKWDPRSTHQNKLVTHEIPTRKHFGPSKYRSR